MAGRRARCTASGTVAPLPPANVTAADVSSIPLPLLRDDVVFAPYAPDASRPDESSVVASTGSRSFLLSASAARVLRALAARPAPATLDDLRREIERDGVGPAPSARDVAEFLAEKMPPDLRADLDASNRPVRTPLLLRVPLLPPAATLRAARALVWLYHPRVVALLLPIIALLCAVTVGRSMHPALRGLPAPGDMVALIALTMLVHELGHVTATAYHGAKPGEIGFGMYFWFPVLYADVSRSWVLPRGARLAVGAGGFYFQAIAVAVAAPLSLAGSPGATWFVFMNAVAIVHMLNPMFKMDGYWLLSDLAGIPNLHRRVRDTVQLFVSRAFADGRRATSAAAFDGLHPLRGWQHMLLLAYAATAVLFFSVIGARLWSYSLDLLSRDALSSAVLHAAQATMSAPNADALTMAALRLAFLVLQPLLLIAAWVFIIRGSLRLIPMPYSFARIRRGLRLWFARNPGLPRPLEAEIGGIRTALALPTASAAAPVARAADRTTTRFVTGLATFRGAEAMAWLADEVPPPRGLETLRNIARIRPVVLAAPLHATTLATLGLLVRRGTAVDVLRTPLTATLFGNALDGYASCKLLDDREMLAIARRAAATADAESRIWMTFPEHHAAFDGGRWESTLCGQPHCFTLLDLLLAARSGADVWTLDAADDGAAEFVLRRCAWTPGVRHVLEQDEVDALYDDLGTALTRVLKTRPGQVLSWSRVARNATAELRQRDANVVATVRAFLHAWSEADTSIAHRASTAIRRLADIEERVRRGAPAAAVS